MIAMPQPLSSPFMTDDAAKPTDISKHHVCHSTVMLKTEFESRNIIIPGPSPSTDSQAGDGRRWYLLQCVWIDM